jgi:hypothetical protein
MAMWSTNHDGIQRGSLVSFSPLAHIAPKRKETRKSERWVTVICESNLAMHRHGYALMQEATGPSEKAGRMLACCKKITNPRLGKRDKT